MKKIVKTVLCFILGGVFITSCSKKIDEAYQNPNADVRVLPEELLPQIISAMAGNYGGHGPMNDARYIGAYVQNWHFSTTQSNFDRMGYTNSSADIAQSVWRMHYYDIGQNNQRMIQWATEEKKWDYVGVGKAIEAWSWLLLTDYHGDVILKEAFNTSLITFKYDTQEEVYAYIKKTALEAIENLDKTGDNSSQANLAKGDGFFYGGDVAKWKKFANGILARVYNRYSNKASIYNADSVLFYANRSLSSNADNAMVKFAATNINTTNNFLGPFRSNLTGTATTNPTAIRQGAYSVKLLTGGNSAFSNIPDPRAIYLFRKNTNNTFVGVELNKGQTVIAANDRPENFWGISQAAGVNNTAGTGQGINPRYIFRNDAPIPVMTASEIEFIKAEAYLKKSQTQQASAAYIQGISLNFDMLSTTFGTNVPAGEEITATNKATYIAAVTPVAGTNNLTLSKVMLQKYISLYGHGVLETWVDMRRYHYIDADPSGTGQVYADFVPPTGSDLFPDNNGKLVYRYQPRFNSEYVWNILELQRIGATAIDYHTKPIWFSQP